MTITLTNIIDKKVKYLEDTHKLNDYNEIYNTNSYIKNLNDTDFDRVSRMNQTLKNKIMTLKQQYLINDHDIEQYKFRINILYFTVFIICILLLFLTLFVKDKLKKQPTIIICSVIIFVYLLITLILVKINLERRQNAYKQFYWSSVKRS